MMVELPGTDAGAVVAAILERARRRRAGAHEPDGRKIALVVEGGAMRGIRSAGGVLALEALGFTDLFDEAYGTSAGAVNASYFLAAQAAYGTTIYYQNINNPKFINRLRPRKVVDIDFLVDHVMVFEKPLLVERVLKSRTRLFVSVTDVRAGEGLLLEASKTKASLLCLLKASAALPVVYNRVVDVDGRPCIDGGVANTIPLRNAIDSGCTDLLVLLTRPPSYRNPDPGWVERRLFAATHGKNNQKLCEVFLKSDRHANEMRDMAFGRIAPGRPVNIATLCPAEDDAPVDRMTRDAALLKTAAKQYAHATLRAFGSQPDQIVEVFQPVTLHPHRSVPEPRPVPMIGGHSYCSMRK